MSVIPLTRVSSNWKQLQAQLETDKPSNSNELKRKRSGTDTSSARHSKRPRARPSTAPQRHNAHRRMGTTVSTEQSTASQVESHAELRKNYDISANDLSAAYGGFFELSSKDTVNDGRHANHKAGKYLALDCEMVGTGPPPHSDDVLARVSIVNFLGEQIYDSYVLPPTGIEVEDYRSHVSGIEERHLRKGVARSFAEVQKDVADLLQERILVGHALKKDLQALQYNHPQRDIRDTSRHAPFRVESRGKPPALRNLVKMHLNVDIQKGAHSSLEDARATMMLYKKDKAAFEEENRRMFGTSRRRAPKATQAESAKHDVELSPDDESDLELLDGEDDLVDGTEENDAQIGKQHTPKTKRKKQKKRTKR